MVEFVITTITPPLLGISPKFTILRPSSNIATVTASPQTFATVPTFLHASFQETFSGPVGVDVLVGDGVFVCVGMGVSDGINVGVDVAVCVAVGVSVKLGPNN